MPNNCMMNVTVHRLDGIEARTMAVTVHRPDGIGARTMASNNDSTRR
jgi:hypothetical protein